MKTKSILKTSVLVIMFLFLSRSLMAQAPMCNYNVVNTLPCPVNVTVSFYHNTNTLCKTVSNTIPASSAINFNCNPTCNGSNLTNVIVTLNWVTVPANVPSTPTAVDQASVNDTGVLTQQPCNGMHDVQMGWTSGQTIITQ